MAHLDGMFSLCGFQLDSPWGEEDVFFLLLYGQEMDLRFDVLPKDALAYLVGEIEDGLERSAEERKELEIEELFYQPPARAPIKLSFVFEGVGSLQALYQSPDRLWQMVFDDTEDDSQVHVWMSTQQVIALLKALKEALKGGDQ